MAEQVVVPVPMLAGSMPMGLTFSDASPVVSCYVMVGNPRVFQPGIPAGAEGPVRCAWHAHGDSIRDAVVQWVAHLSADHRADWPD